MSGWSGMAVGWKRVAGGGQGMPGAVGGKTKGAREKLVGGRGPNITQRSFSIGEGL